eukprot:CAMPEP_0173249432 /NCGR_PEP_ID=MMETSP1142-20121109/19018_1 /TAXON_ID=483371 /ORGANISM="non described non described, Strain CCMP2298" /LENGTH=171 /DNA_ID=CAMNT_0014182063 /DNA_START=197 /DNA_END=715 /DNA_ORIENTATION=+
MVVQDAPHVHAVPAGCVEHHVLSRVVDGAHYVRAQLGEGLQIRQDAQLVAVFPGGVDQLPVVNQMYLLDRWKHPQLLQHPSRREANNVADLLVEPVEVLEVPAHLYEIHRVVLRKRAENGVADQSTERDTVIAVIEERAHDLCVLVGDDGDRDVGQLDVAHSHASRLSAEF